MVFRTWHVDLTLNVTTFDDEDTTNTVLDQAVAAVRELGDIERISVRPAGD